MSVIKRNLTGEEIAKLYLDGESTESIGKLAGVSDRQIRRILNAQGIDTSRKRTSGNRKYTVNESFFRKWSNEMAYVFGLALTDGCLTENNIVIAQKEPEILRNISDVMKSDIPVVKRSNNGGKSHIHTLTINRKSIVADLARLGLTPNKSLTVPFPDVPAEYLPHFIRGVIDGDGWVHERGYTCRITSGSAEFAEGLLSVLLARNYNARIETNNYGGNDVYRVVISGKNDIKRLGQWIYADCGVLFLARKRRRFETHLDTFNAVKYRESPKPRRIIPAITKTA